MCISLYGLILNAELYSTKNEEKEVTGIISEEKTNAPPCWKITKMKYNLQFYNRVSPFHFEKSVECCGSTSSRF